MKKSLLSFAAICAMSTSLIAGGDISPIEEPVPMVAPVVAYNYAGGYIGIAYAGIDAPITNFNTFENGDWFLPSMDLDLSTGGIMINAGYRFNAYIAVEGRYWAGGNDNTDLSINYGGGTIGYAGFDVDITSWGIYAKPMYPVTTAFDVYGLLGYGSATFDRSTDYGQFTYSESLDISGFSWGLGLAYSFTENISVFADYVKVASEDIPNPSNLPLGITDTGYNVETYNVGVAYNF